MAVMTIDFSGATPTNCRGTLAFGALTVACLGMWGFPYPADFTIRPSDRGTAGNGRSAWSSEFSCWLPDAVLLVGQRGVYLHADITSARGDLSHGNTHGCINLRKGDAVRVYDAITGPVRVLVKTPGNWGRTGL